MITAIKDYLKRRSADLRDKPVMEAYDAWSDSYDYQPGNLMLDLDEQVFSGLLENIDLGNKRVVDIGCGTGRHWQKLFSYQPNLVIGFDVSQGMLNQLRRKFPAALTQRIADNRLDALPGDFVDCIISTLTIAHIKNIDEAVAAWTRVLKNGGDLIITDFHPEILAKGGKRSFNHHGSSMAVVNYVHPLKELIAVLNKYGFVICKQQERYVDEAVRHYYEAKNAIPVYNRFAGLPVIYGLHLKKQDAAQ